MYIDVYRMPRPAINDYTFYKIVNINNDVDLCYVGSTSNFRLRKISHKQNATNPKSVKYNMRVYQTIREYGGWEEFQMIEIGREEQLTLTQARQKEEEYRVEMKANMNQIKCYRSEEERIQQKRDLAKISGALYRKQNAEIIKKKVEENKDKRRQARLDKYTNDEEYKKKKLEICRNYYIKKREEVCKKRRELVVCECGCELTYGALYNHRKSPGHIYLMSEL